ncbi:MAG TPA: class I SAM-dependent methyltransferase [Thermodesulfovibrionales bacterium]|nr:class I SAM-dependent methyltransferase [Thermodesulfovibrionales bacterium]
MYLSPRLKEPVMQALYQDGTYFAGGEGSGYEDYLFQGKSLRITFRGFLTEMRKRGIAGGKLLEVGSGYGFFLAEAADFFPQQYGAELSEEGGSHARKISGAPIHVGGLGSLPAHWKDFDTVVAINVIEHIYAPLDFLAAVRPRMKEDGTLVVATPNIGSLWYALMKKRWPSFKIPEHVAFYTKATLTRLLERAGFSAIREIPFLHAFPLGLIAAKFGVPLGGGLGARPIKLPGTMIALAAGGNNGHA